MVDPQGFTRLFRIGSVAALLAALLFRRNIGAEVSLFTGFDAIPQTVAGWFELLQTRPLVGLSFLAVFDLVNYVLVGLIFLALCAALWQADKSLAAIALASGLLGVAVRLASNNSLSMLALSQQYASAVASAAADAQKTSLLAAGRAVLAANDPHSVLLASSAYISLLLIALAGLLFSILLLRTNRAAGVVGLIASGLDLAYCLTVFFAPALRVLWLAAAGLF